jgi:hypothetical protein
MTHYVISLCQAKNLRAYYKGKSSQSNQNHQQQNQKQSPLCFKHLSFSPFHKKSLCAFTVTHANIEPKIADVGYLELQISFKLSLIHL